MISPKSSRHSEGRPLRLLHLMAFVGAVAVSCYVIPAVVGAGLRAMMLPSLSRRVCLVYGTSFTLILWTFLLAGFTLFERRRSLRRAGRS